MHYRALRSSSPLYLSSCGHLAIRIDEWPEVMPDWPVTKQQILEDKLVSPDVWAPTAKKVAPFALPSASFPAAPPPSHASGPEREGAATWLAETMEMLPQPLLRDSLQRDDSSSVLLSNKYKGRASGFHHPAVRSSEHSGEHDDYGGRNGGDVDDSDLHQCSGELHPPDHWTSGSW